MIRRPWSPSRRRLSTRPCCTPCPTGGA
jgi:hypothetical protein